MGERIKSYRKRIDDLLSRTDLTPEEYEKIMAEHLQQIAFFQHERLVHLIVTMTVAILAFLSIGITLIACYLPFALVFVLLMCLFVPYILHYMLLENETQKMYSQYDKLLEKTGAKVDR